MSELTGLTQRELHYILKQRNITYRYGEERFREETDKLVE
jgi:predicted HTH domain antitoxin